MATQQLVWRLAKLSLVAVITVSLGGCPPPPEPNQSPIANAGPDQTVLTGANVALNGLGSSDPDGDTLTFAWTQTAGTAVTLTGANTASATFVAPGAAAALTFQLTVNDGNGGTASDTVTITVQTTPPPPVQPQLFIACFAGNNVVSYLNPKTVNGNIAPNTNLAGAQTQLANPADIVVDSAGALTVANFAANRLTSYDGATSANGNFAPDRNVSGAATALAGPVTLAVNRTNDLVFVANRNGAPDNIAVYASASTTAFNGNLAPTRSFRGANISDPIGINFGASDNLYVANSGTNTVAVFANASNLNGTVTATRVLNSPLFAGIFDVFVDGSDRLYVVVSAAGGNRIHMFNNASTLNGNVSPNFTLTVQGAVALSAIAVDSTNTGYIVDATANAVYQYDNIATLNGTLPPTRTIGGSQTQLLQPIRVFLVE